MRETDSRKDLGLKAQTMRQISCRRFFQLGWLVACLALTAACQGNGVPPPTRESLRAGPLLGPEFDVTQAVLRPADMQDLFTTTSYSISQSNNSADKRGIIVTYPTEVMEHSSAFAQGFSTEVEVYSNLAAATEAYDQALAGAPVHQSIDIGSWGDASQALTGDATNPLGETLGRREYFIVLRRQNAVVIVTIRRLQEVPASRLQDVVQLTMDRLAR
jgi:hypothetical protein